MPSRAGKLKKVKESDSDAGRSLDKDAEKVVYGMVA
jgi:hypothetical protein